MKVTAWHEVIGIPTYGIGKPEKNPIFLEKRIYQGSSGVVYPHPVIEKIEEEKSIKEYEAIFMENDYLKIMILPALGGRVHRAYDKIRQRDFIYYNQVIKPALVGLTGPWISGGIEFNWPQHHRPSTFDPVDATIEQQVDGSVTVWVNEVEKMFRTKGMAGFTLYPDKAYLEIKGRLYNRTPFAQSFLWWANPAVKVNDAYQSVFPPDVHAVFDHGKRDVSDFPIATGTYYKVDYSPGTDISMYKNIPVPTSFMAVQSKYDFIGCYEHDTRAGMLHVANHHVSNGKKQWTWGNGDFGKAWDRNLTDEDGPYIEIMCGVFTDNQPDFSWIQPGEEKSFEQYFMPYAEIGMVKNATKEAALNLEFTGLEMQVKIYVTAVYKDAKVLVYKKGTVLNEIQVDLTPTNSFQHSIPLKEPYLETDILIQVIDAHQSVLVQYQPESQVDKEIPLAAKAALLPEQIISTDALYLNGLHLEQYRHASFSPLPYYEEAVKRDAGDLRNNNALGLWYLKRGQFEKAVPYFRTAIKRLTERNPNPYDGEAYYNLGLCLKLQGIYQEAFDVFYKATWNDAWKHCSFFELARIASIRKDYKQALYLIDKAILIGDHSHSARHLKVALWRKLDEKDKALAYADASLQIDPFNFGCLFERYLVAEPNAHATSLRVAFIELMRDAFNNYLEYAIDYMQAGMYQEAIDLLFIFEQRNTKASPLLYYYLGWLQFQLKETEMAVLYFKKASAASPDYCFPNKLEDKIVLEVAISQHSEDAKAPYYLGNFWYANRQYEEAIKCWELSIEKDPQFATVQRNLSLAYYNKLKDFKGSLSLMERAFSLDHTDARVLMELDQLYKILNYSNEHRMKLLELSPQQVSFRDDLYLERITLYNQLGDYAKAKALIAARQFHPWEGGEGKVVAQFLICHIELAKQYLIAGKNDEALQLLEKALVYPENLGEGKLLGTQENDIHYLIGCGLVAKGNQEGAKQQFVLATQGISEPVPAIFYNDPQPDKIFYQGLAWIKLADKNKAKAIFNRLISFGQDHMEDQIKIDYFAVSLPDLLVFDQDLQQKNIGHCSYLIGLGHLGLGAYDLAKMNFQKVLKENVNHQGAGIHLKMIDFLKKAT